ncbi:MAG: transporter [Pirellula sp.]|nr:transporter [Pirellula sp.]
MLARFFIDRPIFAWVLSIVITLIGGVAAMTLPIAQYPDITPPTVSVTCTYPGADAQVVADSVAAPIEQQVNGVERMMYMSSQCTNDGVYNLTVTFELGTDLNMAQVLVQNRVALATPQLPQQVQVQGVSTKKKSPSILLVVNLISPDGRYNDLYLSNYATTQVRDELLRVTGVGDVNYLGQRDYSMRVWLDPSKMAGRGLTSSDVIRSIQAQNVQVAAGQIGRPPVPSGQQFQYTMSTLGRLTTPEQFGDIILKTSKSLDSSGKPSTEVVRVRDVARIELGAQQYDQISRLDGRPAIGLAVFQLPGSNALETAELIKAKMEELKKGFRQGVDYQIVYDTTPFIEQSVEEVFATLRDAVILVAIVVLLFLQDWKAMILPMIDVPVSLIGTFAVMAVMGFTLNNLTLFGLVLAIGIVVDDAIVVLENIERLIATGLNARDATIKAMDEVTGPILAITLVLCSVFLPCAFIPGISGQFFRQFALTIAASMIISAINAMTLTPARAVTIFKGQDAQPGEHHGDHPHEHQREALPWWIFLVLGFAGSYMWLSPIYGASLKAWFTQELSVSQRMAGYLVMLLLALPGLIGIAGKVIIKPINRVLSIFFKAFNRVFDRIAAVYGATVARMVRVGALVMLLYGGLLYATYWSMSTAPKGFIPLQDQGYLLCNVQLPDSASVERTSEVLRKIERFCLGDKSGKYFGAPAAPGEATYEGVPGVAHTNAVAGQSFLLSANGSNFGSCFIILEPFSQRHGHETYDDTVAQKVRAFAAAELEDAVVTVFRAPPIQGLGTSGGFKLQVEQRGQFDLVELQRSTDEIVAAANKDNRIVGAFSMFRAETPQLYVDIDRTKCESLDVDLNEAFNTLQVYMGGMYVNLFNEFGRTWQVNVMADEPFRADVQSLKQLQVRNRAGKMVQMGTIAKVEDRGGPVMVMRYNMYPSAAVNLNPAPGTSSGQVQQIVDDLANAQGAPYDWTEIMYMQIKEGSTAMLVFALGTLLVYLVLAAKYESWSLPMAVILVVPMCLLCAVSGMLIMQLPVDIFVQIGFLVLIGLAAKNAILIVEFAEQLRREGHGLHHAIVEACRLRLRPIIMTSFAFILGVVPLIVGHGAGAEMRVSLGTAVFSGMIGVTVFGIFLTPVFYYVIMRLKGVPPDAPVAVPASHPAAPSHSAPPAPPAPHG